MVDNVVQVSQIVSKLLDKTRAGNQKWSPGLVNGRFQARFGDFTVEITGRRSPFGAGVVGHGNYNATIKITKLDGTTVVDTGSTSLLTRVSGVSNGPEQAMLTNLDKLYGLVSDRSDDLDELLKLL